MGGQQYNSIIITPFHSIYLGRENQPVSADFFVNCILYLQNQILKFAASEISNTMFENLSDKLDKAFHILKGHGKITDVNVADTLKEVRRALLDADVNFKIAKDFTTRVRDKAIGENVLTTLQPGQLMVKLVKDELTELMGQFSICRQYFP